MYFIARIQFVTICAFVAVAALAGIYVVKPVALRIAAHVNDIVTTNRDLSPELEKLEHQKKTLSKMTSDIQTLADSGNSGAQWYAFLQQRLQEYGMSSDRINASAVHSRERLQSIDYSFQCRSTYHKIGQLINALETGPFICSVDEIHLIAKSTTSSMLDVGLTVTFYGGAQ